MVWPLAILVVNDSLGFGDWYSVQGPGGLTNSFTLENMNPQTGTGFAQAFTNTDIPLTAPELYGCSLSPEISCGPGGSGGFASNKFGPLIQYIGYETQFTLGNDHYLGGFSSFTVASAQVPEPASVVLLGVTLLWVAIRQRGAKNHWTNSPLRTSSNKN